MKKIDGNLIDIINRKIYKAIVEFDNGRIHSITPDDSIQSNHYIMPGLIDAHIHIESSMLIPSEFARAAVKFGTVATVSDPHEIANVLGRAGVEFMHNNAQKVPFKFYFGVPSCVPATGFESSGATINSDDVAGLFADMNLKYLSEMMNFPGVIYDDAEVDKKLSIAKASGKVIDGHAPGLRGDSLKKYISKGITTDHECFDLDEAKEKISLGMKVIIRDGSAAKNYDTLKSLIKTDTSMCMLCSDDKHPDDLAIGHIDLIVKKALAEDFDLFDILQVAVQNPIEHYSLDVGMLRPGDAADFIVIDNPNDFNVLATYINGNLVAENGRSLIEPVECKPINVFNATSLKPEDLIVKHQGGKINVISAIDGELITERIIAEPVIDEGNIIPDIGNDILKIVVLNRYEQALPAIAFIKNIGLQQGALATSVAHDSHNIIAVGTNDKDIAAAINLIIESKGGMAVVCGDEEQLLPLPVGGLMSDMPIEMVAQRYNQLNQTAANFGSMLKAPFMTLSFMALLVIPKIKLSDKGLFDAEKFCFIDLEVANDSA